MPSPIAHTAVGCAIYYLARPHLPQIAAKRVGPLPTMLLVTTGFSLLPDVDAVVGILAGNFGRFHNNSTHSLVVGVGVALAFTTWLWRKRWPNLLYWFLISLVSYELHIVMDWATIGRGVMAWWPFTSQRYLSPLTIFYGLHWSDGWISSRHLWTALTELTFAAVVGFMTYLILPRMARYRS